MWLNNFFLLGYTRMWGYYSGCYFFSIYKSHHLERSNNFKQLNWFIYIYFFPCDIYTSYSILYLNDLWWQAHKYCFKVKRSFTMPALKYLMRNCYFRLQFLFFFWQAFLLFVYTKKNEIKVLYPYWNYKIYCVGRRELFSKDNKKKKIDLAEYIMPISLCIALYMLNWIAYVTVLISIYPLFWLQWSHGKIPVFEKHMFEIVWFSIYNLKGSEGWDLRIPTGCSQCDIWK